MVSSARPAVREVGVSGVGVWNGIAEIVIKSFRPTFSVGVAGSYMPALAYHPPAVRTIAAVRAGAVVRTHPV